MTDIEEVKARVAMQAVHVARLHGALKRVMTNDTEGAPAGICGQIASEALQACERDSIQILADLRTIMFSDNEPEFDPAWSRLEELLLAAGLVTREQVDGAIPH